MWGHTVPSHVSLLHHVPDAPALEQPRAVRLAQGLEQLYTHSEEAPGTVTGKFSKQMLWRRECGRRLLPYVPWGNSALALRI